MIGRADPEVTVVVPVFNAAGSVLAAVSSVLDHSSAGLQVICIDDGSTDDSVRVLGQLAASDNRVSVIGLGSNRGVSTARNVGIEQSRGTYVRFLDADDTLPPGGLDSLLAAARGASADMAIGGVLGLDDPDEASRSVVPGAGGPVVTTNIHQSAWLQSVPGHHCGNLYRRQLLQQHHIRFDTDLALGEDQVFQATAMLRAESVALIRDNVYFYHWHRDTSVTNRPPSLKSLSDDLEWRRRIARLFSSHGLHQAGLEQHRNWSWSISHYWLKIPAVFTQEEASAFFSLFRSMSDEFGVEPWNASTPANHRRLLEMIMSGRDDLAYALLATGEAHRT
jgi:glycosyltransferase involved in cell wall biosynthesis